MASGTPEVFDSLRDYVAAVDERGLLQRIEGADWDIELGAITEAVAFSDRPRALWFDPVVDYPAGFSVLTNLFVTERLQALALGLNEEATGLDLVKEWRETMRHHERIEPEEVSDGPVRENVMRGSDVDILHFPVPQWREIEGGRYFGTGDITITQDPDSGWVNAAPYRTQVYDGRTMLIEIAPAHHGIMHLRAYWERGEAAPLVVTGGQDPYSFAGACTPLPQGYPELEFAGGLKGEPIEVIIHEGTGLPIPATAEIAVIGRVPPLEERTLLEGPFGECTGYLSEPMMQPVIEVEEIWYRDDPILQGCPEMRQSAIKHALGGELVTSARMWDAVDDEVPNVRGVYAIYQQCQEGAHVTTVSIEQAYAGQARQAALEVLGSQANGVQSKAVIVVDEDIDPSNWEEVLFAFSTRCDPAEDIDVIRGMPNSPLDPRITPEARERGEFVTSSLIIDACKPYAWKDEYPERNAITDELAAAVIEEWDLESWTSPVA